MGMHKSKVYTLNIRKERLIEKNNIELIYPSARVVYVDHNTYIQKCPNEGNFLHTKN